MPTMRNHDHSFSLFASTINAFVKLRDQRQQMKCLEQNPGVHIGHIAAYHRDHMIVLSGYKGYKDNLSTHYRPANEIWIYDQVIEKWIKKICSSLTPEEMPRERSGAVGTIIDNSFYMFGGYSEDGNVNSLHRLDLDTFEWCEVKPSGIAPLPCDKSVCWTHEGKVYLFAGYGRDQSPVQWHGDISYQFILDTTSHWHYVRGWSNQFVCYDPTTNSWQWPQCTGTIPVPRAAHAIAKIGDNVYLFGGRNGKIRLNDMYVLNMCTMEWRQIMSNDDYHPIKGRSWHSLTPVSDNLLVLYGGFSTDNKPLNDCWIFDVYHHTWTQVQLPFDKPRLWHTAILSSYGEVLIFGGAIENIAVSMSRHDAKENIFANDMFAIRFEPKSLLRLCLSAVTNSQELKYLWNQVPAHLQSILFHRSIKFESTNTAVKLN